MQNPLEDTEWNDILREKGILPAKPVEEKEYITFDDGSKQTRLNDPLEDELSDNALDALEDELLDDEDVRALEAYRRQRIQEMMCQSIKNKFGQITEISQVDFVNEVTEASTDCWVVLHLYKPGIPACKLLESRLEVLASRHPATKFLRIIGDHCIPNYPDRNLPTLLIYGKGDLQQQKVGLSGLGDMSMRVEDLESYLLQIGALETAKCKSAPDSGSEESDDD